MICLTLLAKKPLLANYKNNYKEVHMADKFDLYDVYEQNLNFLFGAGASFGFLPTLALNIKDANGDGYTFETLAKELGKDKTDNLYTLLFMHYYKKCIYTGLPRLPKIPLPPPRVAVLDQICQLTGQPRYQLIQKEPF
jgi:hypothetical protein